MDEIRVAILGTKGFPDVQGGIEMHCQELYRRLASMGCRIRVYARKGYVKPETIVFNGVEIFPIWTPRRKNIEAIVHTFLGALHIGLHKRSFDLVHIHAVGPSLLTPVLRLFGLKVIVTNHGPDYDRQKWGYFAKMILRLGELIGTRYATAVIAVSRHIKKTLEEKYGRDVFYIPNGVTMHDKSAPGVVMRKYDLQERKYILAVGRIVREKGFHDIISAFSDIDTDLKLVIAGGADHEDNYTRELKERANRDRRIVMTGVMSSEALSELYSNAALFVSSSYIEGLPITVLEAMSFGLPVLISRIPAHMELIDDESLAFNPGDMELLRDKLREFSNMLPVTGGRASSIEFVQNEFDW
ncbi:MAG: hypothetical protein A2132_01775, partial [Nitrospirae bacterium RBG_16_43_11]